MITPVKITDDRPNGELPDIIRAAYAGDISQVAILLENGVSVNSVDPRDNLSILHIACMQGDSRLAELVLQRDKVIGDVDFTIKSLFRPRLAWQFAANGNHLELAARVHDAGIRKNFERTPK